MKINVQYPQEIVKIIKKTPEEMRRYNPWDKNPSDHWEIKTPVNQEHKVYVRRTERLVQEEFMNNEDYAQEQVGTTPSVYQARYGRAWND